MGHLVFKKILAAFKKSIDWLYRNWFLRLWLTFGGLIGISTVTSCPCCGQPACPTGLAIPVILGGVLAGFGFFGKKIREFFGKCFGWKSAVIQKPPASTRTRVLYWVLILLVVITALRFGSSFLVKPVPKHSWQPARRVFTPKIAVLPQSAVTQTPIAPVVRTEKPAQNKSAQVIVIPVQTMEKPLGEVKNVTAKAPVLKGERPKLKRMSAVIGPSGAVEIKTETIDLVRYETVGFMELNDDMYARLNLYEGKKAEIQGFVYRRSDFKPHQFVVARSYMWCCAFDAAPIGPLCEWDRASELADGDWIKVEGVITKEHFEDSYYKESGDIPVIKIEKVERIPKLESPYVYARNQKIPFRIDHRSKSPS